MSDLAKQIAEFMVGTCNTESRAAEAFDIDEDRVTDALVAELVSCCAACGWWEREEDMVDEGGEMVCTDCAAPEED